MEVGVSVILCCYNSAKRLNKTLEHLYLQEVPKDINWEIILINNGSSDNTVEIAKATWKKLDAKITLKIIDQNIPGLTSAREKGIENASFEYLVFCDDDNWLKKNYVSNTFEIFTKNPAIALLGGENQGVFEKPVPDWFNNFKASYAIGEQGNYDLEVLDGDKYIVGAGMALRKSVYKEIQNRGYKQFLTDRIGQTNKINSGGDVELSYIFRLNKNKIAYSNKLQLYHYMPNFRIDKKYLTKVWRGYTESLLVFEAYKIVLNNPKSCKSLSTMTYWKKISLKKILVSLKEIPRYTYHKIRGNISYCLPYETYLNYYFYLFMNTKKLVNYIDILRNNSQTDYTKK